MYGEQFVLRAVGYSNIVRIRGVSVSRVYFAVIWIPSRLFHHQRFSFSSLNEIFFRGVLRGNDAVDEWMPGNICVGSGAFFSWYSQLDVIWFGPSWLQKNLSWKYARDFDFWAYTIDYCSKSICNTYFIAIILLIFPLNISITWLGFIFNRIR